MSHDVVWEDFTEGITITSRKLTLAEYHFLMFQALAGVCSAAPGQRQSEGSRGTANGEMLSAPLLMALAAGLVNQTQVYGSAIVAWLETPSLRIIKAPVPGDTISVRAIVIAARPTSNPSRGIVELRYVVLNQRDEEIAEIYVKHLLRTRRSLIAEGR